MLHRRHNQTDWSSRSLTTDGKNNVQRTAGNSPHSPHNTVVQTPFHGPGRMLRGKGHYQYPVHLVKAVA